MCIGRPGVMKTPALDEGMRPLNRLAAEAKARHEGMIEGFLGDKMVSDAKREAAKDALKKAAKNRGTGDVELRELANRAVTSEETMAPTLRRYKTNDATIEQLGQFIKENSTDILIYRD